MDLTSIPEFNHQGLIPPFDVNKPTDYNRSPYLVSLSEMIHRLSIGNADLDYQKRLSILEGFLNYRGFLHSIGLTTGFQWINGSFVTNKELICKAPPNDIDVVTIFMLPQGETQASYYNKNKSVFDLKNIKTQYFVDANYVCIAPSNMNLQLMIEQTNYWHGLWSHHKQTLQWKGYLQVDLMSSEDSDAQILLNNIKKGVVNEKS